LKATEQIQNAYDIFNFLINSIYSNPTGFEIGEGELLRGLCPKPHWLVYNSARNAIAILPDLEMRKGTFFGGAPRTPLGAGAPFQIK
jgi:hypothetical protein